MFPGPQEQVLAPGTSLQANYAVDHAPINQQIPDKSDHSLMAGFNIRNLSTVLKDIYFWELAMCFATKNGIKVTMENAKCVQANAFIQAGIF